MTLFPVHSPFVDAILQTTPVLIDAEMQDMEHTRLPRTLHMHNDRAEILLIRKGNGTHIIGNKTYQTQAGDILIFNANVLHDESADQVNGMEILSCSIGNIQLQSLPPNQITSSGSSPVLHDGFCTHEAEALLTLLLSAKVEPQKVSKEMASHLASSLILLLYQASMQNEHNITDKTYEFSKQIQQYIDQHYLEDISIASIAAHLKVGESYVSHTFKKAMGFSVFQYIIRRRIGEAQSWLLMTDLPVTDIATKVGYNSVSNFHNTFHRVIGMSPQQYRRYWEHD